MHLFLPIASLLLTLQALPVGAAPAAPPPLSQPRLTAAEQTAAFRAAGFKRAGTQWRKCDDPGTPGYTAGQIETIRDLDGDGRPEAIIVEGSSFCHGMTGQGYALVSKQANGSWRLITEGTGIVQPLATRGTGNWPDLEIGGPGFCFPVERWNGQAYQRNRYQYQGRRCRPSR